jgi:hypothetical protein
LHIVDEDGRRRIDNPEDFVRIEVVSEIKLGKRVVPMLVNNGTMPRKDDLPADTADLIHRQAVRLTHENFANDCYWLIAVLREKLLESEEEGE